MNGTTLNSSLSDKSLTHIWHACGHCRLFCTCQSLMFGQLWQKLGIKCNKKSWYLLTLSAVMVPCITCMQCTHKTYYLQIILHNIYCRSLTFSFSLCFVVVFKYTLYIQTKSKGREKPCIHKHNRSSLNCQQKSCTAPPCSVLMWSIPALLWQSDNRLVFSWQLSNLCKTLRVFLTLPAVVLLFPSIEFLLRCTCVIVH